MRIPRQFPCMGHTVKVRWKKMRDNNGSYDDEHKTIWLHPALKKGPRSHLEQVFCHEVQHCWLLHSGHLGLYEDEKFVDVHASLLQQFLASVTGSK